MNELITRWLGRLHHVAGVAACGVEGPDGSGFSRTWDTQFPEPALTELWARLRNIAKTSIPKDESAESLRWTFNQYLVTAVVRGDGTIFFVLRLKDPAAVDSAGIDRLLNEFRALR